jgi:hypothetical protein
VAVEIISTTGKEERKFEQSRASQEMNDARESQKEENEHRNPKVYAPVTPRGMKNIKVIVVLYQYRGSE